MHNKRFNHFLNKPPFIHLCLLSALLLGTQLSCGKRKPPLPPVERVVQLVTISGNQMGNKINLSWQMPARNALSGSTLNISRADVYRLAEPTASPLSLTEEEFASRSTLIASVPITDSDFAFKQKTYVDVLQFAGQRARLRYAIKFVNASGQKAAFSNFFLIEPTSKVAKNPNALQSQVTQQALLLVWNAPTSNIDGSTPPNILGYNIYRYSEPKKQFRLLNQTPLKTENFSDNFFEFEKKYRYFVRTVSLGRNGRPIESDASVTIEVLPKDTFAPKPPSAITIASAPNSISIFFATNLEKDVVGYNVYRTADPNIPKSQWKLLTPNTIKTNTFLDSKVESDKTYYYFLIAVDKFGNKSAPSEVFSETAL